MAVLLGAVAIGVVLMIAAWAVLRESHRLAAVPPSPTYEFAKALEWVVERLPDDAAATLTVEDVRLILDLALEYLRVQGASGNGPVLAPTGGDPGPVIVGGPETIGYIIERADAAGTRFIPEQVDAVLETQLAYLRSIGAVGPRVEDAGPPDDL